MKMTLPFGKPLIGLEERNAVAEVLSSPILVHGPKAIEFENEFAKFTGAPHAVSVSSCTAGMHLIYFTLGIGPGDEVIIPAQTHIATAHAAELTGAKTVFVDAESETGNIDINKIELAITPRTKAIAVVHYLGVPVDMPLVKAIADKHKLYLLEDCALSPGAYVDNIHTGLHGDFGVFSFYPVKHITTAEGGMIILKNPELASKLRLTKAFGVDRTHGERKVPGVYDTIALGFNYRMSEIHAAIGIEQLKKLPSFLSKRLQNHEALASYLQNINGIRVLPQPMGRLKSSHYCLSVIMNDNLATKRPEIMQLLTNKGIGSSVYYPKPVPRMSYYKDKYNYDDKEFLVASTLSDNSIALPVGPHLSVKDMKIIATNFIEIINTI
jgi:perosamine synthetase